MKRSLLVIGVAASGLALGTGRSAHAQAMPSNPPSIKDAETPPPNIGTLPPVTAPALGGAAQTIIPTIPVAPTPPSVVAADATPFVLGRGELDATLKRAPAGLYGIPGAAAPTEAPRPDGVHLKGLHTQPNLKPGRLPKPVMDSQTYSYTLFDVLEYRPKGNSSDFRWDIEGWRGGDFKRIWFKTEGQQNSAFKADYDIDFQLLSSRLIGPYTSLQFGGRLEAQKYFDANVARPQAVAAIQTLVPYNYETQASLFIDPRANLSLRASATKDTLFTQRIVLQSRLETNLALQRVDRFTTGAGLNNLEFGLRLRYEIRREFAPYIGISFDRSFGGTASLVRAQGGDTSQTRFNLGVRAWF